MKGVLLSKIPFLFLILLLSGGVYLSMIQNVYADPLEDLHKALPDRAEAWTAQPEDRLFDDKTIFEYIDGAGEVYRAYNMRRCLSRRYTTPSGPPIVLDIFDMQSSKDAFGVFTHDQDGEILDLGQGALYRSGWLSFWKDRFFVSIYMEEESAAAERAVKKLAEAVASLITAQGPKPQILLHLPLEGLDYKTIRYLHHPTVLNFHFYLADENILNIGAHTEAALATYQRDKEYARLLLVAYPDKGKAAEAHGNFLKHYLPDADSTGAVLLENKKWSVAALKGKLFAIVLEADSRHLAEDLLKDVKGLDD